MEFRVGQWCWHVLFRSRLHSVYMLLQSSSRGHCYLNSETYVLCLLNFVQNQVFVHSRFAFVLFVFQKSIMFRYGDLVDL